jgi:hypothetical protein
MLVKLITLGKTVSQTTAETQTKAETPGTEKRQEQQKS